LHWQRPRPRLQDAGVACRGSVLVQSFLASHPSGVLKILGDDIADRKEDLVGRLSIGLRNLAWQGLFSCANMLFMRTSQASVAPSDEVPERILRAAQRTFSEMGFDGAKTREIASRAKVPLGLLRYYFGDKLKLWQAAVDRSFSEIRASVDTAVAAPGDGDALANIRAAIRAHVHYVARNPEFVRLMHDEGKRPGPRMRWMVDRHIKPMFEQLLPVMQHLQEIGRLPKDIAPLHFAYALIGAIDVIFHQVEECRRVTGVNPMEPDAIDAHARAVEFMLLGAPAPEGDT
jgi:TetR/AcrR family transcriptional regulator